MTDDQPVTMDPWPTTAPRPSGAEVTAAAEVRAVIALGLRRCRVEDGSPVRLIREPDVNHIAHMVAAALRGADLLADPNLTAERDRARDIAVALEGQVAAVRALHTGPHPCLMRGTVLHLGPCPTLAVLDPDPVDSGTGRDGEEH